MKYVIAVAMVFAAPAYADKCENLKKMATDYQIYAMALVAIVDNCNSRDTTACKVARKAVDMASKDGPPLTAGNVALMRVCD